MTNNNHLYFSKLYNFHKSTWSPEDIYLLFQLLFLHVLPILTCDTDVCTIVLCHYTFIPFIYLFTENTDIKQGELQGIWVEIYKYSRMIELHNFNNMHCSNKKTLLDISRHVYEHGPWDYRSETSVFSSSSNNEAR